MTQNFCFQLLGGADPSGIHLKNTIDTLWLTYYTEQYRVIQHVNNMPINVPIFFEVTVVLYFVVLIR